MAPRFATARWSLATQRTTIAAIRSILWLWIKKSTHVGLPVSRVNAPNSVLFSRLFCKHFSLAIAQVACRKYARAKNSHSRMRRAPRCDLSKLFKR